MEFKKRNELQIYDAVFQSTHFLLLVLQREWRRVFPTMLSMRATQHAVSLRKAVI
jgi:hypothetical protein